MSIRLWRFLKLYLCCKPRLVYLTLEVQSFLRLGSSKELVPNYSFGKRTVLFVDSTTVRKDSDAGSLSIAQFMDQFADHGWQVHLWPFDQQDLPQPRKELEAKGIQVILFSRSARAFKRWMQHHISQYDVLFVSRPALAAYLLPWLNNRKAIFAYYGHDLHSERFRQEAMLTGQLELRILAWEYMRLEQKVCAAADYSYYPSAEEVYVMSKALPQAVIKELPPYSFDLAALPPPKPPASADLLFVGNFRHMPNLDAANWLLDELWPSIFRHLNNDARLIIAGAQPPKLLTLKASNCLGNVLVTGWVSEQELNRLYQTCRVVVIPLRFGAGIKHKLVSAIIQGCPVVTTEVGLQGLPELGGVVGLAKDTLQFTLECSQLIYNDELWISRAKSARLALSARFSRESMWTALQSLHLNC